MIALALQLALALSPPAVPAPVVEALQVLAPGGHVEVVAYRPTVAAGCEISRAELPSSSTAGRRIAVRVAGKGCIGWAWVEVRRFARAWVTTRSVEANAPLTDAVKQEERELDALDAALESLPADAVAAHRLAPGAVVGSRDLRSPGAAPGDSVKVVVRAGALELNESGRWLNCGPSRHCAVLGSGKHVEGRLESGRLVVEVP